MWNVTKFVTGLVPLLFMTVVLLDFTGGYTIGSNSVTPEISEKDPVKRYTPTKEERKYLKRRERLKTRWGLDIDDFLERYGYLQTQPNTVSPHKTQLHSRYDRKAAIRLYQEFHRLKATGKLNKKTVKMMKVPRCGLPDIKLDDPYSRIRLFHYYKYYPRWRRSVLTWKLYKYTKKISPLGLWKTVKKAFETWSSVTGLRFLYTRQTPDIQVDFEHGNHGDSKSIAFDEKDGQVAHAFGPGTYTISGNIHFDDDEDWTQTVNPKTGINLLAVTIHEIGHSLGLHHSNDPRSVMFPTFVTTNLDLSVDDIEMAQILYGPNPDKVQALQASEKEVSTPKICKIPMDDIERGPDGYTYIFKDSQIKQFDMRGKLVKTDEKIHIWSLYEKGPEKVDAVAFNMRTRATYMFYNNTLWRYTNFKLDPGYPRNISGMPETPRAGAFIKDQYGITRLLLFGVDQFWEWSTSRDVVRRGYPLSTTQYFQGLPKGPTAALTWRDGYVYFFKKDKVYKVHTGSYNVLPNYPKPLPPEFLKDICD